jgi:anti-anti-sigma factor
MADLKIGSTIIGANVVLALKEALTYKNCEELEKVFNKLVSQNKYRIICDMKAVAFLDSMALQLLLDMHDTLKSKGGSLKLFGLNSACHDTLLATRLINVFHTYPDLQNVLRMEI